jgi:UDP-N-acetylglucosamine 1-carboxyvinyltransferase
MSHFTIDGGAPLAGAVRASGSKNAALPMMAASILAEGPVQLDGVPDLADVDTLGLLLAELGVRSLRTPGGSMVLETVDWKPVEASYELVRRMRASFCVVGPLVAKRGRAVVPLPGGCNIGPRPVDLHLAGLGALGADLQIQGGYVVARACKLNGANVHLTGSRGPSVTGTANVLSAAVLADGITTITGAAVEPEIVDLGNFLTRMGARIEGLGTSTLVITGVRQLEGTTYRVIPDRIEAATLLLAGAITRGNVTVNGVTAAHLGSVLRTLRTAGLAVRISKNQVTLQCARAACPVVVTAQPYPGIPSDLQAQWMALLCLARGRSMVRDCVFPYRFKHVDELRRLGAKIDLRGSIALIDGVKCLRGASVTASDLRASAALILAGLAAHGQTTVHQIHHLDRGYQRLEEKLSALGAAIRRVGVTRDRGTENATTPRSLCTSPRLHRQVSVIPTPGKPSGARGSCPR